MRREYVKEIAKDRIDILLSLAKKILKKDPELAKRYVQLAKKVGMKCNVSIPQEEGSFICKECDTLLIPGYNCIIRVRSEGGTKTVITCLKCGSKKRYPAIKEKLNKINRKTI